MPTIFKYIGSILIHYVIHYVVSILKKMAIDLLFTN